MNTSKSYHYSIYCLTFLIKEYLSPMYTKSLIKVDVQNLNICCQTCEGSASHVPMSATKSKERVSNKVHEVITTKMYNINIHFARKNIHTFMEYYTCSLVILILCNQIKSYVTYTAHLNYYAFILLI
jgi:hypothetical protein